MSSTTITTPPKTTTETKMVDEDALKFYSHNATMEQWGMSMIEPGNQILREGYMEYHQQIQDFEVFEDDIWVCVFPKSGKQLH